MAYRSPVNIGLGEQPAVSDPALFKQFQPVYNAIHILNQYLDNIRTTTRGGGSDRAPWESMQFASFFWLDAAVDIDAGQVVCWWKGNVAAPIPDPPYYESRDIDGAVKGFGVYDKGDGGNLYMWGISQTTAAAGEKVQIGIGPAIINLTGISTGQILSAKSLFSSPSTLRNDGTIYYPGIVSEGVVIGVGVAPNAGLIFGAPHY